MQIIKTYCDYCDKIIKDEGYGSIYIGEFCNKRCFEKLEKWKEKNPSKLFQAGIDNKVKS